MAIQSNLTFFCYYDFGHRRKDLLPLNSLFYSYDNFSSIASTVLTILGLFLSIFLRIPSQPTLSKSK